MLQRSLVIALLTLPIALHAQLSKECFNRNGELVEESESEYCVVGERILRIEKAQGYVDSVLTYVDTVTSYYSADKKIKSLKIFNAKGLQHGNYIEYYPNTKLKEVGRSVDGYKEGLVATYHPDGKMRASLQYFPIGQIVTDNPQGNYKIISYRDENGSELVRDGNGFCNCLFDEGWREVGKVIDGVRDSVWTFYRDGKVAMVEYYRRGKFIEGTRYDEETPFRYTRLKEDAMYTEGNDVLPYTLMSNWTNPSSCYGLKPINIVMTITAAGEIQDPRILKGKNAKCDQEILKLVKTLKKFYPARERGKAIAAKYILPINLMQY